MAQPFPAHRPLGTTLNESSAWLGTEWEGFFDQNHSCIIYVPYVSMSMYLCIYVSMYLCNVM